MKILLLGATGRTGKQIVKAALQQGIEVNCLARNSSRITEAEGLTIIEGDATKPAELEKAIDGCDFVISTLNISRKSDFPWSPLRTPPNFLSDVMSTLIPIAEQKGIKRVVVCSAWGVGNTRADIPTWFRMFIDYSNIGVAYKDHERQEALIAESNLSWTIVRPVGLTNATGEQLIKESYNNTPRPSLMISRWSVAKFMIDSLTRDDLIGKKVVISKS